VTAEAVQPTVLDSPDLPVVTGHVTSPTAPPPVTADETAIGKCKACKGEKLVLQKKSRYCLERCYGEMLQAGRINRPRGRPSHDRGHDILTAIFQRYIPESMDACLTEICAMLPRKNIYAGTLSYMPPHPEKPTATQLFCAIVAKYDKAQRVLPELRNAMRNAEIRIPRTFKVFGEEKVPHTQAAFSLINYLAPSTEQTLRALQDLTGQMNNLANRMLLPKELLLAVTIYHARVTQLQKPTVSSLFDIFLWVLAVAQEMREYERAATRYAKSAEVLMSLPSVQKLNLLQKYRRDLMGEIGGSPRAAKRLGLTSGDALSEIIDRAPRAGHSNGTGPRFSVEEEVERAKKLLALESTVGAEAVAMETDPMPEAEVEEQLVETLAALKEIE
jgi:hypothetical protein